MRKNLLTNLYRSTLLILMSVSLLTSKLSAQENNIKVATVHSSFNKNEAYIDEEPAFFPLRNPKSTPHSKETTIVSLGSSGNIYGLLGNRQTYLSYDSLTNTLVYIHRGNGTTHPIGVIVADYSKDGGDTWTNNSIVLADNRLTTGNNGNRYPNVALLNKGTSNPDEIIITGVGPSLADNDENSNGWARTYRASKKLNNTAGKLTYTANSYMSASGTGKGTPNDFNSGSGLFANTDSTVFCAGSDINISADRTKDSLTYRNYYIWKGTRTPADTLKWKMVKKLTPNMYFVKSTTTGNLSTAPLGLNMAFGPSGKVGYLVGKGLFKSAIYPTHNNSKFYIAKTTDYGETWTHIGYPRLESIPFLKNSLGRIAGSLEKRAAPFGDFDVTVDAKDSLHIFCNIAGQSSQNPDSLGFIYSHPSQFRYYDITLVDTSKTGFSAYLIDSAEVIDYTWYTDPSDNSTNNNTLRANLSRTADGKKIFYTWSDTDPINALEVSNAKRNSSPDAVIMARDIITGKWAKAKVATFGTVANEVYAYGFTSPIVITNTTTADYKYEIPMGYAEPSSSPLDLAQVKYISDIGFNESDFSYDTPTNKTFKSLFNPKKINLAVKIFPNPNVGVFTIKTGTIDNYTVHVTDILGRTVFEKSTNHTNSIKMDMSTFQKGLYFISLHNSKGFASNKVMIK